MYASVYNCICTVGNSNNLIFWWDEESYWRQACTSCTYTHTNLPHNYISQLMCPHMLHTAFPEPVMKSLSFQWWGGCALIHHSSILTVTVVVFSMLSTKCFGLIALCKDIVERINIYHKDNKDKLIIIIILLLLLND